MCSGSTGNTLNTVYPNNEGFFYYMGTRAENKFWDVFSGETGYTTSSGYPLPPPETKEKVLKFDTPSKKAGVFPLTLVRLIKRDS